MVGCQRRCAGAVAAPAEDVSEALSACGVDPPCVVWARPRPLAACVVRPPVASPSRLVLSDFLDVVVLESDSVPALRLPVLAFVSWDESPLAEVFVSDAAVVLVSECCDGAAASAF